MWTPPGVFRAGRAIIMGHPVSVGGGEKRKRKDGKEEEERGERGRLRGEAKGGDGAGGHRGGKRTTFPFLQGA